MKDFIHNIFTTRKVLSFLLLLSIFYSFYAISYKTKYWGFSLSPKELTDVWTVEAKISFDPIGDNTEVSFATPNNTNFEILNEEIIADGYEIIKEAENKRIILKAQNKKEKQNIYYRLNIYDNPENILNVADKTKKREFIFSDEEKDQMDQLYSIKDNQDGDLAQQLIKTVNFQMNNPSMSLVLPVNHTSKEFAQKLIQLLGYKEIKSRMVRVLKLIEGKKTERTDIMLEAFIDNEWKLYNLDNAQKGLPKNYIIFQRGGTSLLDVMGGENSKMMFSVLKSIATPLKLAQYRAKNSSLINYTYSIYTLPVLEQNTLKWLMIFPLAILIVVLMRNIIGVATMGTFTPMLLAMSLVKTGLIYGIICFSVMIFLGLLMRALVSKLNLLLVPRISFVVIFVILLIQILTIIGFHFNLELIKSAVFFPIIITAWIIERASITWEEDGAKNTLKEILFTFLTALATYFIISSEYVRHFMFAFNELNLVILFIVMLLGTYTGYRLTELFRFLPLIKKD